MFISILELNCPLTMLIQWANTYKTRAASITLLPNHSFLPPDILSRVLKSLSICSCVLRKATPVTGLWCAQNTQNQGWYCFFLDNFLVLKHFHNRTERTKWKNCFAELLGSFHRQLPLSEPVYRQKGKKHRLKTVFLYPFELLEAMTRVGIWRKTDMAKEQHWQSRTPVQLLALCRSCVKLCLFQRLSTFCGRHKLHLDPTTLSLPFAFR